jgi:hypothetical protein
MQEKLRCKRKCNLRYFPGVFVEAWVGSMYYVLLDLYRHNRGSVDGDFRGSSCTRGWYIEC